MLISTKCSVFSLFSYHHAECKVWPNLTLYVLSQGRKTKNRRDVSVIAIAPVLKGLSVSIHLKPPGRQTLFISTFAFPSTILSLSPVLLLLLLLLLHVARLTVLLDRFSCLPSFKTRPAPQLLPSPRRTHIPVICRPKGPDWSTDTG